MRNTEKLSLEQIRAFLEASEEIEFEAAHRQEVYDWITQTIRQQEYWKQKRAVKGVLRRYIAKMTGLSRAQVTRLLSRYGEAGAVGERSYARNRFPSRYTGEDIELLAAVDEAHQTLSGPATQKILYREFPDSGDRRYQRLASISVAHIYICASGEPIASGASSTRRRDPCRWRSARGAQFGTERGWQLQDPGTGDGSPYDPNAE